MQKPPDNLQGLRFGKLEVLEKVLASKISKWKCRCDCGTIELIPAKQLKEKYHRKSCKKCGRERNFEPGAKFGCMTVVGIAPHYVSPKGWVVKKWTCNCDCGNEVSITTRYLLLKPKFCNKCKSQVFRKASGESIGNYLYLSYKKGAKDRKIQFDLSKLQFLEIGKKHCHYCGAPPRKISKKNYFGELYFNGLDRVNNSVGYKTENVVACCTDCNLAKDTLTQKEFLTKVTKIYDHQKLSSEFKDQSS